MGTKKRPWSSSTSTTHDDEESCASSGTKFTDRHVVQETENLETIGDHHVVSVPPSTSLMDMVLAANAMKPGTQFLREKVDLRAKTVTVRQNTFVGVGPAFQHQMASKVAAHPKPTATTSTSRDATEAAGPVAPAPPESGNRPPSGPTTTSSQSAGSAPSESGNRPPAGPITTSSQSAGSAGATAPFSSQNASSTSQGSASGDRLAEGTPSTSWTGQADSARATQRGTAEPIGGASAHSGADSAGGNAGTAGSSRPRIIAVPPIPVRPRVPPRNQEAGTRRTGNAYSDGLQEVPDLDQFWSPPHPGLP